jgi:hypothetical protein
VPSLGPSALGGKVITQIVLGLGAIGLCVLVIYLLAPSKRQRPVPPDDDDDADHVPPPFISLFHARMTPSPEELQQMFAGEVATADVLPGSRGFALTYANGRTVQIKIVDCEEHRCEDTYLIAEERAVAA